MFEILDVRSGQLKHEPDKLHNWSSCWRITKDQQPEITFQHFGFLKTDTADELLNISEYYCS